ncbi:MAG: EF-hand domain-containing protein [Ekhidna sp.]
MSDSIPVDNVLSEIQKRKIHHLFNVLDIDGNGFLQPDDFVHVGKSIIELLSLDENSRAAKLILLKSHRLFVQLLTDLHNPDLSLTLWDWIEFFRDQIENSDRGTLEHYILRTSRHIFDLFDINGDKKISRAEYTEMLTIYDLSHETVIKGFEDLDENRDDVVSAEEMIAGLRNFFLSSDPDAKGNLIFGDWKS